MTCPVCAHPEDRHDERYTGDPRRGDEHLIRYCEDCDCERTKWDLT